MKKMSRFRKWLIKKLGGYTDQEIRIVDKLRLQETCSVTDEFVKTYGFNETDVEDYVKTNLQRTLYQHIKRKCKITKVYNSVAKYTNYFITIDLDIDWRSNND